MALLHPDSTSTHALDIEFTLNLLKDSSKEEILVIGTPYGLQPDKQIDDVIVPFNQVEYFENFSTNFAHVLPDIKSGKTKLVFLFCDAWNTCNEHEKHLQPNGNFLTIDIYNILYKVVTDLDIKQHSVFSTPSSIKNLKQHDDWPAIYYTESFNRYFGFKDVFGLSSPKSNPLTNKYFWLNRRSRSHRVYALHQAFRSGMLKDALYTFHNFDEGNLDREYFHHVLKQYLPDDQIDLDFLNYTRNDLDPEYDVSTDQQHELQLMKLKKISESCSLEIVSEFNCSNNKPFLTEKIGRSIVMQNPFVILGDAGTLEEIRRLGFRTFNKWIDESYDTVTDVKTRIDMALHAARNCDIMSYDTELKETLEYNYNFYFSEFCEQQTEILRNIFK